LVHLPEYQRRVLDDSRLLHLLDQSGPFASALPYPGEHRYTAMLAGDGADELHDQNGLPDAGTTKQAHLAAPCVGLDQVDDLDASLEQLGGGPLVGEGRGRAMDGNESRARDWFLVVYRPP